MQNHCFSMPPTTQGKTSAVFAEKAFISVLVTVKSLHSPHLVCLTIRQTTVRQRGVSPENPEIFWWKQSKKKHVFREVYHY